MSRKRKEKPRIDQIVEKGLERLNKAYKLKQQKSHKDTPYIENFKLDNSIKF